MARVFFQNLFWAVVLLVLQVMVFNHIRLLGYATPMVGVAVLCVQPVNLPRYAWLLWGFIMGVAVDFFAVTPGLSAAALTVAALVAPVLLRLFVPKDSVEDLVAGYRTLGARKYMSFVVLLVMLFQLVYVLLEFFSFFSLADMLLSYLGSCVLSIACILVLQRFREGWLKLS